MHIRFLGLPQNPQVALAFMTLLSVNHVPAVFGALEQ